MNKRKKAEFIIGFVVAACIVGAMTLVMLAIFWLVF